MATRVLDHLLSFGPSRFRSGLIGPLPALLRPEADFSLRPGRHFTRCDQLVAGLSPTGVRPCWAHNGSDRGKRDPSLFVQAALVQAARLCAMNASVDHLLEDVLRLTAAERSAVAAALIDSLESGEEAAISEAWRIELLKRRDDLRAGRVLAQPWADVRARLSAL